MTVTKRGGKESKNEDVEECGRAFILYEISCERTDETEIFSQNCLCTHDDDLDEKCGHFAPSLIR